MESELLENMGDPTRLKEVLRAKRFTEIVDIIGQILEQQQKPDSDVNVLEALACGVYEHEELLDICESTIDRLWAIDLSDEYRVAVSIFLHSCTEYLEDWKLERLCFRIIQRLRDECSAKSCVFELFAKALVRLEQSSTILTPMTKPLCSAEWNNENCVYLVDILRDYPLSASSRMAILLKTLKILQSIDLHLISPLCKPILLFSCVKTLPTVLQHISSHYYKNAGSERPSAHHVTVRECIVNQIFDLCNEAEQFGSTLLQVLKVLPQDVLLSEFMCEVCLTVIPIQPLRNQVLRSLSSAILNTFANNYLIAESSFLRGLCDAARDPASMLLQIGQNCIKLRREHVTRGLIILSFGMLRSGIASLLPSGVSGLRGPRVKSGQRTTKLNTSPFAVQNATGLRVIRLAGELVTQLFQTCPTTRDEIINVIVDLVWSESSRPIALQLVDLLADLVALCPMEVACRASRFDSILDSIGLLPQELAVGLVHALLPLIRAGSQLQDSAIPSTDTDNPISKVRGRLLTTLCKAASSPRVQSRRNAVACFLLLLKHLKVSVSAFRSASQNSSGSLSQASLLTQTQSTQNHPCLLYSQLQSTQIARQAIALPCDAAQNEALCTEIVSVLHRIIFSAFFRSQSGSLLEDPGNRVKSDIYWGLCEVVTRNRGLVEPVLTLYLRLLIGSLSPSFLRRLKQTNTLASLTVPTVLEQQATTATGVSTATGPALVLDQVVKSSSDGGTGELCHTEHPDIIAWCLQLILTLPLFNSAWKRYRLHRARSQDSSTSNSESTQLSNGFSQFTQSSTAGSIECGRSVSPSLFSKAATLLLVLSDSLRTTPLDEFGLTAETDFGSTATGKLNRERANVLLGLYDACLEFELKDPLESVATTDIEGISDNETAGATQTPTPTTSWARVRQLFARRVQLRQLVYGKTPGSGTAGHGSLLLLPATAQHDRSVRPGLLVMGLISAAAPGGLSRLPAVLRASFTSDIAGGLAHHLLLTIAARLSHFTHCSRGRIPYAYRDQLLQAMVPILRHVIRYYNHKLSGEIMCSTRAASTTDVQATSGPTLDVDGKSRSTSPLSTAALTVLDTAFALALDQLGTSRLHRLTVQLYAVASNPNYRYPLPELDEEDLEVHGRDSAVSNPSTPRPLPEVTPAQALSTLIKLIKGWITKLFNSGSVISGTQKPATSMTTHTRDLVVLLPLLVRLCRARAQIGSDEGGAANTAVQITSNPLAGLDRVLAWLVRLMRAGTSPGRDTSTAVVINAARVQLITQAVWLAHLVGTFPNSVPQQSRDEQDRNTSMDFILKSLASDLHQVLGDTSANPDSSSISCGDSEFEVTFPLVTRSTALSLLPLLCSTMRKLTAEFEWLLNSLTPTLGGRLRPSDDLDGEGTVNDAKLEGNAQEEALCRRLVALGETLAQLLQSSLPVPGAYTDSLLELAAKLFNFLTQLTKYYLRVVRARSGRFPVVFERVVRCFGKMVSTGAYSFISYIQNEESEKLKALQEKRSQKKTTKSGKKDDVATQSKKNSNTYVPQLLISRSIKESRSIPQLIFAIEQFERFLMQLSKKSKVNLMSNVKLAVSRDFRINQATVQAQLERSSAALSISDADSDEAGGQDSVNVLDPGQPTSSPREPVSPIASPVVDAEEVMGSGELTAVSSEVEPGTLEENSQNQPPLADAATDCGQTPAWGRSVNPNAHRRSLLKRPATFTAHTTVITKSKRLGPRN